MNVNYREVKRKAAVGERIKIVGVHNVGLRVGDELTVEHADAQGDIWSVRERAFAGLISYSSSMYGIEYVVLEPVTSALSATLQSDPLYAAFRQLIVDNADAIRAILPELEGGITAPAFTVDSAGSVKATGVSVSKPTLTRADVIAKATADVAELLRIGRTRTVKLPSVSPFANRFYTAEFHVNRDKRTVTVLIHYTNVFGDLRERNVAKFTAKCSPADVFHAEIGKAIALRKALGLTVPSEYTDAPQPEIAKAGAIIRKVSGAYVGETRVIASRPSAYPASYRLTNGMNTAISNCAIIDDTDVDYSADTGSAVKAKEAA